MQQHSAYITTTPSRTNVTGRFAALCLTATFLKKTPSCSAVKAMRKVVSPCGGIGRFDHSTCVQPHAVFTSSTTSGSSETFSARNFTLRVSPSGTSFNLTVVWSNRSTWSVSMVELSISTLCSNAARLASANPSAGTGVRLPQAGSSMAIPIIATCRNTGIVFSLLT